MQAFVRLLERIHKIYSIEREASKRIHVARGEIDKDSNDCQTMYGQKFERKLVKPFRIEKTRMGKRETEARQYAKTERNLFY